MAKKIEVYFSSENDAESAHAELKKLKLNDIFIEEMPEDTHTRLFVPFISSNVGSSGTSGSAGPIAPVAPIVGRDNGENNDNENLSHLMHFEVEDEDYEEAVSILKEHDCYGNNK